MRQCSGGLRMTLLLAAAMLSLSACGTGGEAAAQSDASASVLPGQVTSSHPITRRGFLGAFFRPSGPPPYGVFSVYSKQEAPEPMPAPTTMLFGQHGYCDVKAPNGLSISSGYLVDSKKLGDITGLGVRWTRTNPAPFWDDRSHVDSENKYVFADFDSAQCALLRHQITPIIALEAGPVNYNKFPDQYSPKTEPHYKTASDFAQWCSTVAMHEKEIYSTVHRYTMPGNEVNSNPDMFPEGDAQIAQFTEACYHAVKHVDPNAYVYGLELNMDKNANPAGMVQRLYDLGCRPGNCYDGLSAHMSLTYPIPPPGTPCYPNPGGAYGVACLADLRKAAHAPIHILIGETGYFVPSSVRDEAMKAQAIVAAMQTFAALNYVDGVNYANVDECDLYPTGYFVGGCLVDSVGTKLPAYFALEHLAKSAY
jgi:hypothetical protein